MKIKERQNQVVDVCARLATAVLLTRVANDGRIILDGDLSEAVHAFLKIEYSTPEITPEAPVYVIQKEAKERGEL